MSNYTLHLGDCMQFMRGLPDGAVDMVLCDLPYGTTACAWDTVIPFAPLWVEYKRITKPNAAIVLTASQPFTTALIASNMSWFKHDIVWEKDRSTGHLNAQIEPMRKHEDILVFCSGRVTYNPQMRKKPAWNIRPPARGVQAGVYGAFDPDAKRLLGIDIAYPTSIYACATTNTGERGLHPTQKPVALMEYLIRTYSNEGETVLDNCAGSGTTGVACAKTNRRFIGCEIDPTYHAMAKRRIEAAYAQGIFDLSPEAAHAHD